MTKSRREIDNAGDTQYSIGHVPERILVRTTMANQLVRATVANQLLRANQYEHACFGLPSPWSFPSRSDILLHAVAPALALSAAIHFVMKKSAPCFAVLCHSPSSWAAIVH